MKLVREYLYEQESEDLDIKDSWYEAEEESVEDEEVDILDTDVAITDEDEDEIIVSDNTEIVDILNSELKISEISRRPLFFKIKGESGIVYKGIPMANIKNDSFLFKLMRSFENEEITELNDKMKKIKLSDLIIPELEDIIEIEQLDNDNDIADE